MIRDKIKTLVSRPHW